MATTETEERNESDSASEAPAPPPTPEEAEDAAGGADCAVVIMVQEEEEARADVAAEGKVFDGDGEKVCRICHLIPESEESIEEKSELMQIGCGCKNELGFAHRHCAETWFRLKGNRCCEICGVNAKNIIVDEATIFVDERHGNQALGQRNSLETDGFLWGQHFCNFLMACMVIAFILPWFSLASFF